MILFLLALIVRKKITTRNNTYRCFKTETYEHYLKKLFFSFLLFFLNCDNHLILLLAKNMVIDSLDVYNLKKKLDGREINFNHLTLL